MPPQKAHTPTPWMIADNGSAPVIMSADDRQLFTVPYNYSETSGDWSVYEGDSEEADAAFIVEACNNHARLTEENKKLRAALEKISYAQGDGSPLALRKVAKDALNG